MKRSSIRPRRSAKTKDAVRIYPDGREVCQNNAAGRREYAKRRLERWRIDKGVCCLCDQMVWPSACTIEHPNGRGMAGSKRDDRVSEIRVAHYRGNMAKGGMSLERYLELPAEVRVRNCQG